MRLTNSESKYGVISILLHWIMAFAIIFLIAIGLYMVNLGYYDPDYHIWPDRHKSVGILVFFLLCIRIIWLKLSKKPKPIETHSGVEKAIAQLTHSLLYLITLGICFSGYLISTADGKGISVFGLFNIPAVWKIGDKSNLAGNIHYYLAIALIALICLHIIGALKHHIIDKDRTLVRIFGK